MEKRQVNPWTLRTVLERSGARLESIVRGVGENPRESQSELAKLGGCCDTARTQGTVTVHLRDQPHRRRQRFRPAIGEDG
jgi:hypothetical protein